LKLADFYPTVIHWRAKLTQQIADSVPIESLQKKCRRTEEIIRELKRAYPQAHCELVHRTPLQLLIATILSAQCSDRQVNIVSDQLFKKYLAARDFAQAPLGELEQDIKRIGLYRNKAKNIQSACRILVEKHQGQVPFSMKELLELPGVGRKTANVVLGNAFGMNEGIVVDTHVARLSNRLGLSRHDSPQRIEQDLLRLVPRPDWALFSHLLIWHGRRRCYARNPDCPGCEIKELCPIGHKPASARRHEL
jgi:endonuclease-3